MVLAAVALTLRVLRARLLAVKAMLARQVVLGLGVAEVAAEQVRLVEQLLVFLAVLAAQERHQALLAFLSLTLVVEAVVQTTLLYLLWAVQVVAVMADQLTLAYLQQPD